MIAAQPIPFRWSLVVPVPDRKPEDAQLLSPPIPRSTLTPLLAGLLPNRDHNGDLLEVLSSLPLGGMAQPLIALFAADPFIAGKHIAKRLLGKGYRRIVNWPTTAQYGTAFCAALDSVNLGPRQEYENLTLLAARGLSISLAVCDPEAAVDISKLSPDIVFLAPTFDLWRGGKLRAGELLRRCAGLARRVEGAIPIVLMSSSGAVSAAAARKAGASGLLLV